MSRFVRSSKYRHVFGQEVKKELCYDNVVVTRTAWDSNFVAANNTFFAVCWQTAGGGSVGVIPYGNTGKIPQQGFPLITGHKNHVLDIDWHPFNESLLCTVSEDCYGKIWSIPDGGLTENLNEPVQTLKGHRRKIGTVNFHPTTNGLVATSSQDFTVKGWDIEKGEVVFSLDGPKDLIQSFCWNRQGSSCAITCKDKKNRLGDPRTGAFEQEWGGHTGVKGSRVLFLNDGKIYTAGFGRGSERQYMLWDPRDTSKALVNVNIDNSSGILMPHYDYDTSMIYLAGKGDGNIRYYEYTGEEKFIYSLTEFKSNQPTRGGCFVPKTKCDVSSNEVARFLKLENTKVTPISFTVPRKSDLFQDDIFPDTSSGAGEPALTLAEWQGGENKDPPTVNLESGFVPKEKVEVKFEKVEEVKGPKTEAELRKAWEEATNRVSYLEAEMHKKDLRIKELEAQASN